MMRLKQGFPFLLVLILLSLFTKVGAVAETSKIGVTDVESVGWISGPESANDTKTKYDVDGADLGSMFKKSRQIRPYFFSLRRGRRLFEPGALPRFKNRRSYGINWSS